jgi:hypothetical protein
MFLNSSGMGLVSQSTIVKQNKNKMIESPPTVMDDELQHLMSTNSQLEMPNLKRNLADQIFVSDS